METSENNSDAPYFIQTRYAEVSFLRKGACVRGVAVRVVAVHCAAVPLVFWCCSLRRGAATCRATPCCGIAAMPCRISFAVAARCFAEGCGAAVLRHVQQIARTQLIFPFVRDPFEIRNRHWSSHGGSV